MPKILVVDDVAADRELAGGLLQKNPDLSVEYAANGIEALEQLERECPDAILTDLSMPEMDGLQLVEAVRERYPLIPTILITAVGSEEIAVRALQKGAASYVPKRRLTEDLRDTVLRVLAASTQEQRQTQLIGQLTGLSFELANDLQILSSLVNYLRNLSQQMQLFEVADNIRISMALDEALVNAYYHGNLGVSSKLKELGGTAFQELAKQRRAESPYRDRRIHVGVRIAPAAVEYTVRDEGSGFDSTRLPNPTDPANLDRLSGRGVLLMHTFMDDVAYNDAGNQVLLTRHRSISSTAADVRTSPSS